MKDYSTVILNAFETNGLSFKVTKRSFITNCPFCQKEQKFYVDKFTGASICFVCGSKHGIRKLLAKLLGITTADAANKILHSTDGSKFDSFGLDLQQNDLTAELTDADFDTNAFTYEPFYFDASFVDLWLGNQVGMEYCIKRGVDSPATWVRHDLKYHAGMNAVVVPVKQYGVFLGYQARFISPKDSKFRMFTSPGLPRERALMGHDQALSSNSVIIVEGIFDMLKTDLSDIGVGSVATMGKIISSGQIQLIKNLPATKIYIGLDRDAYDVIPGLAKELSNSKEVYRVLPPAHRKDFGECSRDEVVEAISAAQLCYESKQAHLEVYLKE